MSDPTESENKLATIRELYEEICLEADEDGTRDDDELALIARVGEKIKQLEEKVSAEKARKAKEPGDSGQDPKEAWEEISDNYKDLLKLHAELLKEDDPLAQDLNVYLQAISSHLATEDWKSAVNEALLAAVWANENNVWDRYGEDDDEEEEENDASGKTAWDKIEGDAMLLKFKERLRELEDQGDRHSKKVAKSCKKIEDAIATNDWKGAMTALLFLEAYFWKNDLYINEDDEDGGWTARADELFELTSLVGSLVSKGISGASEVAGTLGDILKEAASGNYEAAGALLDAALAHAREMIEGNDDDAADDDAESPEKAWLELSGTYKDLLKLHAELVKADDSFSDDLYVHLQAISSHLATEDWASANNEVILASIFADENNLWEEYGGDEEQEDVEEDASGKTIWEKLGGDAMLLEFKELLAELKDQGSEHTSTVKNFCDSIEDAIDSEDWKSATTAVILLEKYLTDNDLYSSEDEEEQNEGWLAKVTDLDELTSLVGRLKSAGIKGASDVAGTLADILVEASTGNFDTAGKLLDGALSLARELATELEEEEEGGAAESIIPSSASITGSVGKGGKNRPADVKTIQLLLNHHGASLTTDSDCGRLTIGEIEKFQQEKFGWKDGKIGPPGKTFGALTGAITVDDIVEKVSGAASDAADVVKDTAGAIVETVTDAVEDAGEFISDFFGDGDDENEET